MKLALGLALVVLLCTASSASAYSSPRGYWPLNEGRGQLVRDWSGNGNHGELGSSAAADENDPTWIRGRLFAGLSFDGNDYVRIPDSTDLEPAEITVAAFVRKTGSPGQWRYLISKGAINCHAASYGLYSGHNGGLAFFISDGSQFVVSPAAGHEVWDGRWHHAAGTFDGETVRFYVDGVEVGSGTPTDVEIAYGLPTNDDGHIGAFRGSCDLMLVGDVDEVNVWDRALQIGKVRSLLQALR